MKAIYAGTVIAESDRTVVVEGNHYFPPEDVNMEYLEDSKLKTTCGWKGVASYFHVAAGDQKAENAAWIYTETKEQAAHIKGYIAFWKGVQVVSD